MPASLPSLALWAALALTATGCSGAGAGDGAAAPAPYLGAFRHEAQVERMFTSAQLVVTEQGVEYRAWATMDGEEMARQLCTAPLQLVGSEPIIGAMECQFTVNGNRAERIIAFDFSFNGTSWVRRDNGEETEFTRSGQGAAL